MKVARIYLRVSTDEQDLTRQAEIEQSARSAGYYIAGVYREKASGARADRPEILRMIADLGAEGPGARKRTVAVLDAILWVWLSASALAVRHDGLNGAACIARSVIPRVRPHVCCVQYSTSNPSIASNIDCTP